MHTTARGLLSFCKKSTLDFTLKRGFVKRENPSIFRKNLIPAMRKITSTLFSLIYTLSPYLFLVGKQQRETNSSTAL